MKNKELFISALSTLFHSWGGDTPAEAYWGCNELLDWYEAEFNVVLDIRFDEEDYESNFEEVIEAIRNS
jgi:hypothetical protein